ncbi:efflux RND transporter periplasmic adaptor subunit [Psychrosphaera sp. B3R10]|uniref:efflux RND transporter periplasmic adaptor subunit n=1 Tax=unclassified Psychrosphaera TaxID=2641570 RepID=UPI001C090371|nr:MULTISPECIES: efflux RND transporter periplasmic adaptor subunit [unclassified Psychrosphaera]MBU2883458.1 efflux RND transporter periplasmic adaptor subunit [Psychrosphaera sp. I2R16]MBU2988019.1 efflux RND transporter periplasmic adaptor subunit [Psychrosphaera sp. B3R10]MDO6721552.1 efflux RND transporter periplasmic adaptor subunit [Psychrosphaera sp. 1_MG-2023]
MLKTKIVDSIPFVSAILIILLTLYGLDFFKPEAEKRQYKAKKLRVFVERIKQRDTQLFAYSQGEVKPKQQADLRSQVEGLVVFVSPSLVVGGRVVKGQTLLQLDKRDYLLDVVQREAKVAQANQQLEKVKAQANVAELELANLGRKNANDLARWRPQLEHAEAELKAAKALLEISRLKLERTNITSPFTGVVRSESINIGQQVSRNSVIATVYANDVMEVALSLNGKDLKLLEMPIDFYQEQYEQGIPVVLSTELGDQITEWEGRIMRTSGQFDTRTRTLGVIAEIYQSKNQNSILPGLFVNARIKGVSVSNASTLPRTSVHPNNKVWYVDEEQTLQVTQVELIHRDNHSVVVKGLKNNIQIVTSALVAPVPGVSVRTLKSQPNNLTEEKTEKPKRKRKQKDAEA